MNDHRRSYKRHLSRLRRKKSLKNIWRFEDEYDSNLCHTLCIASRFLYCFESFFETDENPPPFMTTEMFGCFKKTFRWWPGGPVKGTMAPWKIVTVLLRRETKRTHLKTALFAAGKKDTPCLGSMATTAVLQVRCFLSRDGSQSKKVGKFISAIFNAIFRHSMPLLCTLFIRVRVFLSNWSCKFEMPVSVTFVRKKI